MSKFIEDSEYVTFDDVLIKPMFSTIKSRQEVDLSSDIGKTALKLPIFSSNMDTVTEIEMCLAMKSAGGVGVLHRFCSIEQNVKMYTLKAAVSCGLGEYELKRAIELQKVGAQLIFMDVAHGAMQTVIDQMALIRKNTDLQVVVGNFASKESVDEFLNRSEFMPDAIKVGVGPGSACTTRIKTGIGVPQLSAILECIEAAKGIPIIADGGMKTPGDIAKALAAGASAVMLGGMLSGTDETPGDAFLTSDGLYKTYRGSASKEAYQDQGKNDSWRAAEGESFSIPHKGSVKHILQDIEGGLRSAFTYVGAQNLRLFQSNSIFIKVSNSSKVENRAHGKN